MIKKHRIKLSEFILLFVVIVLISILMIVNKAAKIEHFEPKRITYFFEVANDIESSEEYQNSDIDGRMVLFYDYLIAISEHGTDDDPDYRIDVESIVVDDTNKTISFCDTYQKWWRYEFGESYLVECTALQELFFLVVSRAFVESDIDSQMVLFYEKLLSMCSDEAERMNAPYIDPDSIEIDSENKVIYYRCEDSDYRYHYSFVAQSFSNIVTPTPSEG